MMSGGRCRTEKEPDKSAVSMRSLDRGREVGGRPWTEEVHSVQEEAGVGTSGTLDLPRIGKAEGRRRIAVVIGMDEGVEEGS